MRHLGIFAVMLLTVFLVCAAGAVQAGVAPPSTDGWTINSLVDESGVHLSFGIDNAAELANWKGALTKSWGDPTLSDPTKYIALGDSGLVLQSLSLSVDGDPMIAVRFSVLNTTNVATPFHYELPAVVYPIQYPKGTATAAVTVTDCDGNGATATGAFNGAFYRAFYNTTTTEQTFKYLVNGPIVANPYDTATKSETYAPWHPIGVPVADIKAEFGFTLSGNDSAAGTSAFTVIPAPEPTTIAAMVMGVLGMGGFALRRRKA